MNWSGILDATLSAFVGQEAVVYALAAIGLNLHFGYSGLLNFGQVGFMAVGAYGVGITASTFDLPLWLGVLVGIAASFILALLLGIPTLRLRADYLAIVTIASGEILRFLFRSVSLRNVTGGSNGLSDFADGFYELNPIPDGEYGIGLVRFSNGRTWILLVGWILVLLMTLLIWRLMSSPWGRVLKAIREDEDAARSLGKNVFVYKMQSLVLGGVIGSLGGMVFAIGTQSVQPDSYSTPVTFFAYASLILGGTATVWGPIIGSMLFWALLAFTDAFLRQAVGDAGFMAGAFTGTQVGQVRFMLVGIGLAALMVFRPQGLFGNRSEILIGNR